MGIAIRPARAEDATAIAAIYAPFVRNTAVSFELEPPDSAEFTRRIERVQADFPWIVAEGADGEILGYAYATAFRARAAYARTCETSVYIGEGSRGQGLGRALMEALISELEERGFHLLIAGATLPNPGSARLHESLGFEPVGTFREVGFKFDTWHDVGFWQLRLGVDE